ncbi:MULTISPECIES: hypothetical protein [Candidatus Rhabdochlamydia]|uniref:hypothetical protein n=1 Tax=Candidatus Rhabdochlamydia TaxID=292833 RepID=UPI001BFC166A|nr:MULTISPECIES: hypothetical protein [Rhabdochlamydia]KAG6558937.1 hypothetical protein RHOW815_001056 [Candidatus Rhabdochlamydia sp. W815]
MSISKYLGRGKPKNGAEKVIVGYKMETSFRRNQETINNILNKKGRFILATNELDLEGYKDKQILEEYKKRQNVEGGFRFLKDLWFMADFIFLKLPKRIEALMMIMIYNIGQYRWPFQPRSAQKRTYKYLKKHLLCTRA